MTEPYATRPQPHDQRAGAVKLDDRRRASYETGESSTSGSLRNTTPTTDRTLEVPGAARALSSSPADAQQGGSSHGRRDDRSRKRQRPQSNGAFLLHDAVVGERDHGHRRQSRNIVLPKTRALPRTPEQPRSGASHEEGPQSSGEGGSRRSSTPPRASSGNRSDRAAEDLLDADRSSSSPFERSPSQPDLDSTQIVSMALNLSESRRIASRRNVSRANPPRLVPLPDAGTGSSLRQHFQQQRKTSRNLSPKSGHVPSPGVPASRRANSPLQPPFETGHDSQYRYQFSQSTLARAQRARDHLELMAQYRRLLEMLPPLTPGPDRDLAASPPTSPSERRTARFGLGRPPPATGRAYNPLQYIRNRKVRARERKVIDGEQQGFGDVDCVSAWVDDMSHRALSSEGTQSTRDAAAMPRFPGADDPDSQSSPEPSSKAAQRTRRPRIDWFMEPCDMIADAYWLEQDNHKHLIEDHHWRKIFPPVAELSRPMSGQGEDSSTGPPFKSKIAEDEEADIDGRDFRLTEVDTGLSSHASTKERAKQKLQDFKFPHRHHGSAGSHHDFLRLRRDSASDLSDSDAESKSDAPKRTRHGRSNTISSGTSDLLEKQMLEMIAKEAREKELEDVQETEAEHRNTTDSIDPGNDSSKSPNLAEGRKPSLADTSDSDQKPALRHERLGSVPAAPSGRQSLEVPDDYHRRSYDYDSSLPTSPELAATRGRASIPTIGADFSPSWSRAGSPTRNPIARVKQKLRERNREPLNDGQVGVEEDPFMPEPISPSEGVASPEKRPSSPLSQPPYRPPTENYKVHRSTGSVRLQDDQGVGLRGIFKGPRIDNVIRGSVSKIGDILWKKDGSSDSPQEPESTDESDSDVARGRQRPSMTLSRRESQREQDARQDSKHFLDTMPQFHNLADVKGKTGTAGSQSFARPSISRPQSRQSSRFNLLKPPRIDVRSASSSMSPPSVRPGVVGESDASESESHRSSVLDGVRAADRRLNSVIAEPLQSDEGGRSVSRHWSITDRGQNSTRTHLSKREVARARALILSSGIKAMEISRRAHEPHRPFGSSRLAKEGASASHKLAGVAWKDIAQLMPEQRGLAEQQAAYCELYPLAGRSLAMAVQASGQRWQSSADRFTGKTSLEMQNRIRTVRTRVADDLSHMTRRAADEADETSKDLALDQPLKVKHVVDTIEKMLRKRRRRFRWVRRALWLTVEWLLIGVMWYVWFVVMILRVFVGVGRGVGAGVRWLLWL